MYITVKFIYRDVYELLAAFISMSASFKAGDQLMLCILGKNFSRSHFEICFLFVPENRV